MAARRAVLFDWSLTLAHYPAFEWWYVTALENLGRRSEPGIVERSMAAVAETVNEAWFVDAQAYMDTSAEVHRATLMKLYQRARLDDDLAEALYELESDPSRRPIYSDVVDVLTSLRDMDVRMGLVSNIHVDVRPCMDAQDIGPFFDTYALSFELGIQKPDAAIFEAALRMLDVHPEDTVMVGDSPEIDGAAARVGIPTLILPRSPTVQREALHQVVRLVDEHGRR